jgi:hypothetical protein
MTLVNSPLSSRFFSPTLISSGTLWSSTESFGCITPMARQMAESLPHHCSSFCIFLACADNAFNCSAVKPFAARSN